MPLPSVVEPVLVQAPRPAAPTPHICPLSAVAGKMLATSALCAASAVTGDRRKS